MKYAIISDIHDDIVSLQLAFQKIDKHKCDEVLCLGDISGFSAPHYDYYNTRNASECLRLIKKYCSIIIAGNHDLHAARKTPVINPGFKYPENWYHIDYQEKKSLSKDRIWLYDNDELNPLYKTSDVEFIKTLPEKSIIKTGEFNILLSHYCYPNLTGSMREFYNYIDDFDQHMLYMKENQCNISFAGHRHFAGLLVATKKKLIDYNFGKKHKLISPNCVLVPAITNKRGTNGFCIFNTENKTIEALRI